MKRLGLVAGAMLALAVVLPLVVGRAGTEGYLTDWVRLAVLATSFIWIAGLAGRLALSHHAFLGLGGYLAAIAAFEFGIHPLVGVAAAIGAVLVITWLISAASVRFRIRDLSFSLLTIALADILRHTFIQVENKWFVGGIALPLQDDPTRLLFMDRTGYFYVYAVLLAGCVLAHVWFADSPHGRKLAAIRDDDTAAESFGQRLLRWTFLPYAAASIVAVLVGFVTVQEQLSARTDALFDINLLIQVITAGMLGGMRSRLGGVLGAGAVVIVDQLVIAASLDDVAGASLAVYGALVVLAVMFLPGGLAEAGKGLLSRSPIRLGRMRTEPDARDRVGDAGSIELSPRDRRDLTATDVRVVFGGVTAVDGVSVVARPGRIHAIIGPNGAGKTTLFNSITGVVAATSGRVVIGDHDLTADGPAERARQGVVRTFQIPRLFESLTVAENVEIGAAAGGGGPDDARSVLGALGIGRLEMATVGELTSGERRMVELARALAARPSVLLVDEVFAGLSPQEAQLVTETLRRVKDAGVAVLLVEHVLSAVRALADHLYVLDQGRLLQEGDPHEVLGSREVRMAYLGQST